MRAMVRVFITMIPCFLILLGSAPAAKAAYSGYQYPDGSFQAYLAKFYGWNGSPAPVQEQNSAEESAPPEDSAKTVPTEAAAPSETQAAVQSAAATSPQAATYPAGGGLQDYRKKYYGNQYPYGTNATQPASQPSTQPAATPSTTPSQQAPAQTAPTQQPQTVSGLSADESLMFDLVNQERKKAGLAAFKLDLRLVSLARQKSQDMVQNNYFGHNSPTYGSPYDMLKKAGISARVMGAENIARASTTQQAHGLLMNSSGHRANILHNLHDTIGIGIVKTSSGVMVTQLFTGN